MKKNSILSLIAAVPAFIICAVIRFIQITGGTDFKAGFMKEDCGFLLKYGFYGMVIITFIAVLLLGILDRKKGGSCFTNEISAMDGIKANLVGFPLVIAGGLAVYEGYVQTTALASSGLVIFVDFLLGGAMLLIGFVILYKGKITPAVGFSLAVPAIYYTLMGISTFINHLAIASVPEYLINCLSIVGFAIFYMLLAKLMTTNESKQTRLLLSSVGLTTAVMSLSNAVAVIAADLINPYEIGSRITDNAISAQLLRQRALQNGAMEYYFMSYTPWVDVAIAIGIVLTLVALTMKSKASVKDDNNEEN